MSKIFQSVKGTKDILPDETPRWRVLEQTVHDFMNRWGYKEIRTPVFEQTDLFVRSVGKNSDVVSKQMYTFLDHGKTSLTLKPELTAPVIRAYIQYNLALSGGVTKLYYIDSLFRQERPQKGRLRQFQQFGIEAIGSPHPEQDAEVITAAYRLLQELGIRTMTLKLNNIGNKSSRVRYRDVLTEFLSDHLDRLSKTSQERIKTNPLRILDTKNPEEQTILEKAPHILDFLDEDDRKHYDEVLTYLDQLGVPYEQDHQLVRGLDYYTRTTFEIISPKLGAQDALCGGGRYDDLVEDLGGKPTPAIGFAAGIERILLAMDEKNMDSLEPAPRIYLAAASESARSTIFKLGIDLRNAGLFVDFDILYRSLKSQLREANRLNCVSAIIIGEDELIEGVAQVKDLQSGEQTPVDLDTIADYFLP